MQLKAHLCFLVCIQFKDTLDAQMMQLYYDHTYSIIVPTELKVPHGVVLRFICALFASMTVYEQSSTSLLLHCYICWSHIKKCCPWKNRKSTV